MLPRKSLALGILAVAVLLLLLGCQSGPKSSAGFRLPNGDVAAGRQVLIDMKCNTCHRVAGESLASPVADPPVPVLLGGDVPYTRTDGELVTAIINPSHEIAPALRTEQVKSGELSRMPDYGQLMSVRQMVDLVAYLHTRYHVIRPGVAGP